MNPESKRLMGNLGLLLGPVLLVKAAAAVLGTDTTLAAEAAAPPAFIGSLTALPEARTTLDAEQIEAGSRLAALATQPMGPSPMLYKRPEVAAPVHVPITVGRLEVVVQMVMQSGGQSVALINGTPYRVGDSIDEGPWRISRIDINARSVELTNGETGETLTGSVPLPR